ncbi:unnamed protein product [Choristocarpus tenellus]
MAPEVLTGEVQGSALDWWGLGVLTFELLMGRTPFEGPKTRSTYLNIMKEEVIFPAPGEHVGRDLSPACRDFVLSLLVKDPKARMGSRGADAVKAHPFFLHVPWGSVLTLEPPLVPRYVCRNGCGGGRDEDRGLGPLCGMTPSPVENTAGWDWSVEDGKGGGGEGEVHMDVFVRFDWSEEEEDSGHRKQCLQVVQATEPGEECKDVDLGAILAPVY